MESSTIWQKRFMGIRFRELGMLSLFYAFFGAAYNMAIYKTSGGQSSFMPNILFDYGLKAIYTIPIWWLLFRKLSHWMIWQKVLLHLFFLPVYVFLWRATYYLLCDQLGYFHLGGKASWWDIYIPGLFYAVQFGAYHVYDFYMKLQKQREIKAALEKIALQSELRALKAQLNPHFLYNTFNTISASVPPEQERTRELIATLSDLFRYQLQGSKTELVPLGEEIAFVKKYLSIEKARFEDRLSYRFELSAGLSAAMVPPMILQPIVENAVKHGIAPKIQGGEILVKIDEEGDFMQVEVSDTGVGLNGKSKENPDGVGLKNTRLRLEKMYNVTLQMDENDQGGVTVAFKIPLSTDRVETIVDLKTSVEV
ncbi:MAG: histidine kinase [Bacteroidota bacterium]